MAAELRDMDTDILTLTRTLAVSVQNIYWRSVDICATNWCCIVALVLHAQSRRPSLPL